eukprot:6589326-Prymnesium_polylepis.1
MAPPSFARPFLQKLVPCKQSAAFSQTDRCCRPSLPRRAQRRAGAIDVLLGLLRQIDCAPPGEGLAQHASSIAFGLGN